MKTTPRFFSLFSLFLCVSLAFSQEKYTWPIDFIEISGNYGEIRPNHFHAGIDFATGKEENFPVFAADSGYVSRIKISPYGYGRVLYIAHPDGKTTVYGHQNKFNKKIWAYVKEQQYAKQSYEIEIFPKPDQFPVKKGELIGYSGNTGGSTGPHLHFEVRTSDTEIPLNPLLYYKYLDTVKPMVRALAFYDLTNPLYPKFLNMLRVRSNRKGLSLLKDSISFDVSVLGVAFSGEDIDKPEGNPNNIYDVKIKFDSANIYEHQLNNISFDQARYVNAFAEILEGQKFQKCFTPKLYPEAMYKILVNRGRISLKNDFQKVEMQFTDESGNFSRLSFFVKGRYATTDRIPLQTPFFVDCEKDYKYEDNGLSIFLPAKALYNDAELKIKAENNAVFIDPVNAVFRFSGTIKLKVPAKWKSKADKVILLSNSSKSIASKTGETNEYSFKNFGKFQLAIDSVEPKIKTSVPLNKLKTIIKKAERLSFVIEDNLSGIDSYAVYVNDKWVLAEYDAKADLLIYNFDENTVRGEMNLRVEVKDKVGNNKTLQLQLNR